MDLDFRYRRLICWLYAAGILIMSILPARALEATPELVPHQDKLIHALVYGGWAVLLVWAWRERWPGKPWVWLAAAVGIAAAYGVLMEGLQGGLVGFQRTCSVGDMLANLVGAGLAVGLYAWLTRRRRSIT